MKSQKSKKNIVRSRTNSKSKTKKHSRLSDIKLGNISFEEASKNIIRESINKNPALKHGKHLSVRINDDLTSFDPNISVRSNGDGKMIPKFHIINSPSFAAVVINLAQGQSVFCNAGALNYMDGSVSVSTRTSGILSGIIRSMFTTTSLFLTFYTGMENKESVVSFSSFMPGDVIAMRIKPGERYVMSSHGFLAASANIKVTTTIRFRNIIGGDSIFMNEVSVADNSTSDGIVWISSYGGFDKIVVKEGESIKVDQGLFSFAKKQYSYELTTIGNIKSFFFSGETFMMRFRGPCEVYVHSNNFNKFVGHLAQSIASSVKNQLQPPPQPSTPPQPFTPEYPY